MNDDETTETTSEPLPPIVDTYLVRVTIRHHSPNVKGPTLARVEQAVSTVIEDLCEGDGLEGVVVNASAEHV